MRAKPTERRRIRFDLVDQMLKLRYVDGQELPNWQEGPEMVEYTKRLMKEGWHFLGGSGRELVFERRVA